MNPNNQPNTIATPYTSPYGNTMQGNQLSQGVNTLQNLTSAIKQPNPSYANIAQQAATATAAGQANQPAFMNQVQGNLANAAQLPQGSADYNKLLQLFQADNGLAGKNQVPPGQQQPSDAPSYGNVTASSAGLPLMTPGNVNNPFSGFSDPSMSLAFQSAAQGGVLGAMSNLMDLINYNAGQMGSGVNAATNNYTGMLNALGSIGNWAVNQENMAGYNPLRQQVITDIQSGKTLTDTLQQYRALGIDPNDIYNMYNIYSPYGAAKESPTQLAQYGIKTPTGTSASTFGVTADEAAAGVAGLPKTPDNLAKFNTYEAQKQARSNVQTVQMPGFFGTGLFGSKQPMQLNKTTGEVTPIQQSGGVNLNPLDLINSLTQPAQVSSPSAQSTQPQTKAALSAAVTLMKDKNGKLYNVPNAKVNEAKSNGWSVANG